VLFIVEWIVMFAGKIIGVTFAASVCLVCSCTRSESHVTQSPSVEPLQVVATVGMVADLVRNVGGPHVEVTQLMGPGVDPHLYKITRDDVRAIFGADVIFASGLMLEGKMSHTLEQMSRRRPVVALADQLASHGLLPTIGAMSAIGQESQAHVGHPDPHVWMDMATWSKTLPFIVESLARMKPSQRSDFEARAEHYAEAILATHQYGIEVIATIPPASRHLITSHDAFGYFGQAYDLEVTGVQGISTDSEAGLLWINQLVDQIVDKQIAAVFVESSVPRKSLEAVIEGVASRGRQLVIGGELYSDSTGPAELYEGSYLGMMDHNLTAIARALGGNAPPRGFRNDLTSITPTPNQASR